MRLTYTKDKEGNELYSGTIVHTTTHAGPFHNEEMDFTTRLYDVRDGDDARRGAENMVRKLNATKGSKYHK